MTRQQPGAAMPMTVISTAVPGAEQGALRAAIDLGLTIGGWRSAADELPAIYASAMSVTSGMSGMARRLCVQDADGTLAISFSPVPCGAVAFVERIAEQMGRPWLHVCLPAGATDGMPEPVRAEVRDWLAEETIATLYVVGPGEEDAPGVQETVRREVMALLEPLAAEELRAFTGQGLRLLDGLVDVAPRPRGDAAPPSAVPPSQSQATLDFLEAVECCSQPPAKTDIEELREAFYKLDGNGAGGSLHVVLDDHNWERESVEFCRKWAADRFDVAGERFAELLLTLTDEQLHEYLCCGYDEHGQDFVGEHPCMKPGDQTA